MLPLVSSRESQKLFWRQVVGLPAVAVQSSSKAPQASSKASSPSDSHHVSALLQQQQQQQQVATEAVHHSQQPPAQDDGSLQIIMLLMLSLTLLLLPWVSKHPEFLIAPVLLAFTPVYQRAMVAVMGCRPAVMLLLGLCCALLLVVINIPDAEAARHAKHLVKKNHDAAHSSKLYKAVKGGKDKKTGTARTGLATDHAASPAKGRKKHGKKAGHSRKLQQGSGTTTITPGMSLCVTAADAAQYITSTTGYLTVSNAAFTAGALILGSGDVTESQRVINDVDAFTADNQLPGDTDLDSLIPGYVTYDATVLEFDVVPARNGELVFQYVFASEEYNEWVDSSYNDVFGFWIGPKDKSSAAVNVAYLPDLVTPTSINNVNFHNFPPPAPFNTTYDGFTTLLNTRSYTVQSGVTYHFKLAIADAGDHILDSVVWIAGGSLLVNNPPNVTVDGQYNLTCPGTLTLHAAGSDPDNDPLHYQWNLTSTTQPGLHIAKFTQDAALTLPDDAIPADVYDLHVTAIDSHGSRTVAASTLTVGKCSEPEGNHPPKAGLAGAPYILQVCNGVGSVMLDASASSETDPADTIKAFVWEISGQPDLELKLTGPTVTLTAAQGFFAGNVYEVEVFVQDSYGINSWAETNLTVVPTPNCVPGGGGGGGGGGPSTFTEAIITEGPYVLECNTTVVLNGSKSTSFNGHPLTYLWSVVDTDTGVAQPIPGSGVADSSTATAAISLATDAWLNLGKVYTVYLTVTDDNNGQATDSSTVTTPAICAPLQEPPQADITNPSYSLACGGSVTIDGSPSDDPNPGGQVVAWAWTLNDVSSGVIVATGSGKLYTVSNAELAPGQNYTATLIVTSSFGLDSTNLATATITAGECNNPPTAILDAPSYSLDCTSGPITLDGSGSSDPDAGDSVVSYSWTVTKPGSTDVILSGSTDTLTLTNGPPLTPGTYAASLVVTDQSVYLFTVKDANGGIVVKNSTSGKVTISQAADGLKTSTSYTVELTVTDTLGATGSATQVLSVGNCAPTAALTVFPATVACYGTASLSGAASSDVEGPIASYSWKLTSGTQSITKTGVTVTVSYIADNLTPGATYVVTLTVKDSAGASGTATGSFTVANGCNNPPVCSNAVANQTTIVISSASITHSMVGIAVNGVTDPDTAYGDVLTVKITAVTQNEATKATDAFLTKTWQCADAVLKSNGQATVATEMLKYGQAGATGRVYALTFIATDSKGASCSGYVYVCVRSATMTSCPTLTTPLAKNSLVCAL
eukprot:gene9203-9370_t